MLGGPDLLGLGGGSRTGFSLLRAAFRMSSSKAARAPTGLSLVSKEEEVGSGGGRCEAGGGGEGGEEEEEEEESGGLDDLGGTRGRCGASSIVAAKEGDEEEADGVTKVASPESSSESHSSSS